MADQFRIIPHTVRAAGTDVPPEQVQFGFNKMANDVTIALNTLSTGESSNVNITGGTIANVAITNSTGATQSRLDNSTLLATDQFVNQQLASSTATVPFPLSGGIYNQASRGTGASFVIFVSGGVISSVLSVVSGGTGYAVGDLLVCVGGNSDGILRVTNVVGGVIQSGGLSVIYGGSGYTTGATVASIPVPPGQRTVTFTGVLTSNVTFIIQNGTFLTASRRVQFNNNTTGAFTVTVFLSNGLGGTTGSGVVLPQGTNNSTAVIVQTDGMNDVWLSDTAAGIGAAPINNPVFTGGVTVSGPSAGANYVDTSGTGVPGFAFSKTNSSTFQWFVASDNSAAQFYIGRYNAAGVFQDKPLIINQSNGLVLFADGISPSQTVGIVGTTTNNSANAGSVGEYQTATTSGTSLTSLTGANVASLSLTAGDWDVQGIIQLNPAATTNITTAFGAINTTSGSVGTLGNYSKVTYASAGVVPNSTVVVTTPVVRISLSATTTVFAVANATFSVSTMTGDGFIRARRVR